LRVVMSKSKDSGRNVEEVFTTTGNIGYKVKCNVVLTDLKQALSLRAIITSFEASAQRRGNGGKNVG